MNLDTHWHLRIHPERIVEMEAPLTRVVALFSMYTFFFSQPTLSSPPLHSVTHIPIPIGISRHQLVTAKLLISRTDTYASLATLPATLTSEHLMPLQRQAAYLLSALIKGQVFHILPTSDLYPLNPREVPREIFIRDGSDSASSSSTAMAEVPKKRGRPSKRDKIKKAKDALKSLDMWLNQKTYTYPTQDKSDYLSTPQPPITTHILLSQPPTATRNNYCTYKLNLLDTLVPCPATPENTEGQKTLERANHAVLQRLKKIDQMAAERGLEVGGEGGERTGLGRVERAVAELGSNGSRGGILGLLEGGGKAENNNQSPIAHGT
jgi:hypothetical protein